MKKITQDPKVRVPIAPGVEGFNVTRDSNHPRAIVRRGEWIASHLDYKLGTFGQVGTEDSRVSPLRYGNSLKEGDKVVPLRKDGNKRFAVVLTRGLIDYYKREGLQPTTNNELLKIYLSNLDTLLMRAESDEFYLFRHENSIVDCGTNHVGDYISNRLRSIRHQRESMSEQDRNFADSALTDLSLRLHDCYESLMNRTKSIRTSGGEQ
ncbi:MAG: hypothetical protein Q8P81_04465 [Nanoarchaeota archaeon]|nr:hypothetical protein [Nanoarchaeota archaeon]